MDTPIDPDINQTGYLKDWGKLSFRETRPDAGYWGLALGGVAGLSFGIVAQFCNEWALPGVSFIHHPLGQIGNILASGIFGACFGWLCSYPLDFGQGILRGGAFFAILFELITLFSPYLTLKERLNFLLLSLAPMIIFTALAVFYLIFFRWCVDRQIEHSNSHWWNLNRLLPALLMIAITSSIGFTSRYSSSELVVLNTMNQMIQEGLAVADSSSLPPLLQNRPGTIPHVEDFRSFASPNFAVEIVNIDALHQALPAWSDIDYGTGILAHFDNGWILGCLFNEISSRIYFCQEFPPD